MTLLLFLCVLWRLDVRYSCLDVAVFFDIPVELVTHESCLENWEHFLFLILKVQQGPLKISSVAEVMKESKQPVPKPQTSKTEAVAPSEEKEGNLTECHTERSRSANIPLYHISHSRWREALGMVADVCACCTFLELILFLIMRKCA